MKSNGYPQVFHCSWRFNLKLNKINENSYECIEQKIKDLFSLDYLEIFHYHQHLNLMFQKKKSKKKRNITFHFWKM